MRDSPIRWLIVGGALLVAGIVIGTATMASVFRERAIHSAERELGNTVLLLARHFDQQLDDFVTIQKEVATQVELARLATAGAFRAQMSTREVHFALRAQSSGRNDVAGVNVFDADGKLINSSDKWPVPAIDISDRAFFRSFKSGTAGAPILVALVRGRFSGGWATVIAIEVRAANGEFLGVLTRAITPVSFENFFASLTLGEGAAISLYHRDGMLLARYPHIETMIGSDFSKGPVHRQIFSKTDHD